MKNSLKHQNGFVQLPMIAVILGIILIGGISYAVFKQNRNNQNKSTGPEQKTEKQIPLTKGYEPDFCQNQESIVPPNNLPEGIASAIVAKYFYSSNFFNSDPPADVDEATFVILPKSYYPAQKSGAYQGELYLPNGEGIILASGYYAKDKNHVYAAGKILQEADPASFGYIGEYVYRPMITPFLRDKNRVWADKKLIEGADPCSFVLLNEYFEKDKNRVYFQGEIIDAADASTFASVGNSGFFKDSRHLYTIEIVGDGGRGPKTLSPPGIDTSTFEHIRGEYFRDKNNVYIGGIYEDFTQIKNADPATFQILNTCMGVEKSGASYAKDKNYVFCGTTIIAGADPSTFEYVGQYDDNPGGIPLSSGVGKDKNCIYRRDKKLLDSAGACINPATCTSSSLASNPLSCGIRGGWGEFQ